MSEFTDQFQLKFLDLFVANGFSESEAGLFLNYLLENHNNITQKANSHDLNSQALSEYKEKTEDKSGIDSSGITPDVSSTDIS